MYGIFLVVEAIFAAIQAWIWWLVKEPFNLSSAITWTEIIVFFLFMGFASSIAKFFADKEDSLKPTDLAYVASGISFILLIIGLIVSADFMHAQSRYAFVEQMVTVVESTEDKSAFPDLLGANNDTSNLPLIGIPEALKKAETEMGKKTALGSQFEILEDNTTSQSINNSLMYVIPLEPKSFLKWDSNIGNNGYYIVDRNNSSTTFVEESLKTTEHAPFGDNTKRLIYKYMSRNHIKGRITEISPEVDDEGNFHYVGTVYTTSGIEGLDKVVGVVEVDAITKECKYYNLDEIPEYVDRVFPESFFSTYLKYYGKYKRGFWNTVFGQKDVLVPTQDYDILYKDGVCYYYTGFTTEGKGESSNGIIMMNCRTGAITYYITYGLSEERAMGIAEGKVQEKGYVASYPLLLEVAGEETYFMLMRDANENLVGYAFVNYKDYQKSAVNESLALAQSSYIKACATTNSASSLNDDVLSEVKGIISSLASEVKEGNTIYYVRVNDGTQIYSFFSDLAPEIVFSEVGDNITISYIPVEDTVISAVNVDINKK